MTRLSCWILVAACFVSFNLVADDVIANDVIANDGCEATRARVEAVQKKVTTLLGTWEAAKTAEKGLTSEHRAAFQTEFAGLLEFADRFV